ncbi:acetyl-CoA acetyltransferase [Alicycliphilus denitrificans]|uniref:Acetyl-CoA acetyltransferase n=1 Tax=Alicycliphilus denitrificans (strain DSM 14773 / CIP 107495 / K601) TaxID=596154 RepID=F4GDJ4_ALIDK|nr:acetyl-CoA acetyltransferase [Alicycliphilus denitrificans]AEB82577.1 acetyl-CoA acetyltransferase [Alicycliphilus denitrificans K601]
MNPSLSKSVAIVGVAESDLGKVPGKSALELQAQAAMLALADAGLKLADVDGVFAHTDDRFSSLQVSEFLNLRPRFVDSTSVGGMSNLLHVQRAMAAIAAGMCEVALITYGSTQLSDGSRKGGAVAADLPHTPRGQFILPYGHLSPIGYYAMVAQLHMHRYGTTPRDLAEVAVAARRWAQLNPKAYRREPTSIDEVMASPLVAEPLRQRDCCLVTDGGGAMVVVSAGRARDLRQKPVYVLGAAETHAHHYTPFNTDDWLDTGVASTAEAALRMAGVTRADIDVVQIYDHFTIGVIQSLEELGFCQRGEGGAFVADGALAPGGRLPVNTSGGGLSYGHPGMFGMFVAIEAVRQLRGECGERQLPKAELALCHAPGLVFSCNTTMILGV